MCNKQCETCKEMKPVSYFQNGEVKKYCWEDTHPEWNIPKLEDVEEKDTSGNYVSSTESMTQYGEDSFHSLKPNTLFWRDLEPGDVNVYQDKDGHLVDPCNRNDKKCDA